MSINKVKAKKWTMLVTASALAGAMIVATKTQAATAAAPARAPRTETKPVPAPPVVVKKANEGPDAGLAVGTELLEIYRARLKQLEPINDVEKLPGYAEVVAPVLQHILRTMPGLHFQLTDAIRRKNWFFVGGTLPLDPALKLSMGLADLKRVGRQNDAIVELLRPWYYDPMVNDEGRGGLVLHELNVDLARRSFGKVKPDRPSPDDVDTLTTVLLKNRSITYAKLSRLLAELGFAVTATHGSTIPLSSILQQGQRNGFGYRSIKLARDEQENEYFILEGPMRNGNPILRRHWVMGLDYAGNTELCDNYFSSRRLEATNAISGRFDSKARYWAFGPERERSQEDRAHGQPTQSLDWVICTRPPYYELEIDIDLGPVQTLRF